LRFSEVVLDTQRESGEFNPQFLAHFLPKLDWPALYGTALEVRCLFHLLHIYGYLDYLNYSAYLISLILIHFFD
jgi:hypothetical protein